MATKKAGGSSKTAEIVKIIRLGVKIWWPKSYSGNNIYRQRYRKYARSKMV